MDFTFIKNLITITLSNLHCFCISQSNFCNFEAFKRVMRKHFPGNLIIILPGLILFLFSCTADSCFEQTESFLKASFYNNATGKLQAPDSLTIYGLNMDTIKLYNKAANVQPALMPLNSATDNCVYIISINGITDTLEFSYISYPHLLSKECGYTFYHTLDTGPPVYTKHAIYDIYVGKRNITTVNEENIRIFY